MSVIYKKYQILKKNSNQNDLFLFNVGAFYIFIGEDAKIASSELGLKLTYFNNEVQKCGFPISSISKYIHKLEALDYSIHIVDNSNDVMYSVKQYKEKNGFSEIVNTLLQVDINNMTGVEALFTLDKLIKIAKSIKEV